MQRFLLIQIIAAAVAAYLAFRKGRSAFAWAIACFFFPPLVILPALLPPVIRLEDLRRCPNCSGPVLKGTGNCPRCGGPMPIDMVECRACGKFVAEGRNCSECGAPLD